MSDTPDVALDSSWVERAIAAKCPQCEREAGELCVVDRAAMRGPVHVKRLARSVMKAWYDHVKHHEGIAPASPSFVAGAKIIETLLRVGHDPRSIGRAMLALRSEGRPVITATIETRLRERPQQRQRPLDRVGGLRFDEHGNLIDPRRSHGVS